MFSRVVVVNVIAVSVSTVPIPVAVAVVVVVVVVPVVIVADVSLFQRIFQQCLLNNEFISGETKLLNIRVCL